MCWNSYRVLLMAEIDLVSAVLIAYPIGCLATGYYLVLFVSGRDIRTVGSGGTGARNVGRVLGRWAALVTLLVDAGKGILAVILASLITSDRITPLAAMMAVTAGHIWPIQLGLGGGKGVATSLGGLLAWSPLLYTVFVGSFLLGFLVSRKATVSVVASYISLPLAAAIVGKTGIEVIALILLSAVIVYLHRGSMLLDLRAGGTT